jgi:arsenate reductase
MSIVIHHNPDCGTSRNVLAIIKASGETPMIIEYLETGCAQEMRLGKRVTIVGACDY